MTILELTCDAWLGLALSCASSEYLALVTEERGR